MTAAPFALLFSLDLTLILLTWRIWRVPNNASKWQMGFHSSFKVLICVNTVKKNTKNFEAQSRASSCVPSLFTVEVLWSGTLISIQLECKYLQYYIILIITCILFYFNYLIFFVLIHSELLDSIMLHAQLFLQPKLAPPRKYFRNYKQKYG